MRYASSHAATCMALASASEYTATVRTPMRLHVRATRTAISPRLAIRILSNIGSGANRPPRPFGPPLLDRGGEGPARPFGPPLLEGGGEGPARPFGPPLLDGGGEGPVRPLLAEEGKTSSGSDAPNALFPASHEAGWRGEAPGRCGGPSLHRAGWRREAPGRCGGPSLYPAGWRR